MNFSTTGQRKKITFSEWFEKIKANFEKHFYIADRPDKENEPRPDLINKRGIYKDCHLATQHWTDYQLRCNYPVAMMAVSFSCYFPWL